MPTLDQQFLQDSKQSRAQQLQFGSSLALRSMASPSEQFLPRQHIPPPILLSNAAPRTAQVLGGGGGRYFDTFFSQGFNLI